MPGVKDFKRTSSDDEALNKVQDRITEFLVPIVQCPLIDGTLLTGVQLQTGTNLVEHKLSRPVRGWFPVRKYGSAGVWDASTPNNQPSKLLYLEASSTLVVDLWVF